MKWKVRKSTLRYMYRQTYPNEGIFMGVLGMGAWEYHRDDHDDVLLLNRSQSGPRFQELVANLGARPQVSGVTAPPVYLT